MHNDKEILNRFLVEVFNEILRTEERCIAESGYENLSIRELHVIEAVCLCNADGRNTVTDISAFLGVVPGTLTAAVIILEKKGYVIRVKDEVDKRMVHIIATATGEQAHLDHNKFHGQMIDAILDTLTSEEAVVFIRGLGSIGNFFRTKNNLKG